MRLDLLRWRNTWAGAAASEVAVLHPLRPLHLPPSPSMTQAVARTNEELYGAPCAHSGYCAASDGIGSGAGRAGQQLRQQNQPASATIHALKCMRARARVCLVGYGFLFRVLVGRSLCLTYTHQSETVSPITGRQRAEVGGRREGGRHACWPPNEQQCANCSAHRCGMRIPSNNCAARLTSARMDQTNRTSKRARPAQDHPASFRLPPPLRHFNCNTAPNSEISTSSVWCGCGVFICLVGVWQTHLHYLRWPDDWRSHRHHS